jgi:hypothetical protein
MSDKALRRLVVDFLTGRDAHATFDEAIADWPVELRGSRVEGLPHTGWQLLEHLRISQFDILDFSRSADHVSPEWPEGYWPDQVAPPDKAAWTESVRLFQGDLAAMSHLVRDPATDLFAKIPWGKGQTILREALLLIDHNAYHVGQLVTLRQGLGAWR